jgi:hypothetical protein
MKKMALGETFWNGGLVQRIQGMRAQIEKLVIFLILKLQVVATSQDWMKS